MKLHQSWFGLVGLGLLTASVAANADKATFNENQRQQIEKIVHQYIVKNPEVLMEAAEVLQNRQRSTFMKRMRSAVNENQAALFDAKAPAVGNPKADVTIVEFFDYQCVHCKNMRNVLDGVVTKDKNVRVVFKDFPIFGPTSEFAARAALAAHEQGKYKVLHDALLGVKDRLTESKVMEAANKAGLDAVKLRRDILSDAITKALRDNEKLGQKMGINATPALIIAKNKGESTPLFVGGAVPEAQLLQSVADLRNGKNAAR